MKKPISRAPLTDKELESMPVGELVRIKLDGEEMTRLQAINRRREQERLESVARLEIEERPLVKAVRDSGYDISSIDDLVNTSADYSEAIPVLLEHLLRPYSDAIRSGIARALAVRDPQVQQAWPLLVEQYRKAPLGRGITAWGDTREYQYGAKDGLACALSVAVTEKTMPDLISLLKDRSLGGSRILLLSPLRKRRNKDPMIKQVLAELAEDPELSTEIGAWKKLS